MRPPRRSPEPRQRPAPLRVRSAQVMPVGYRCKRRGYAFLCWHSAAHPAFLPYPRCCQVEEHRGDSSARPNSRQKKQGRRVDRRRGSAAGRPAASSIPSPPGWGRDWVAGPATSASGARFARSYASTSLGKNRPDVERCLSLAALAPLHRGYLRIAARSKAMAVDEREGTEEDSEPCLRYGEAPADAQEFAPLVAAGLVNCARCRRTHRAGNALGSWACRRRTWLQRARACVLQPCRPASLCDLARVVTTRIARLPRANRTGRGMAPRPFGLRQGYIGVHARCNLRPPQRSKWLAPADSDPRGRAPDSLVAEVVLRSADRTICRDEVYVGNGEWRTRPGH